MIYTYICVRIRIKGAAPTQQGPPNDAQREAGTKSVLVSRWGGLASFVQGVYMYIYIYIYIYVYTHVCTYA